MIKRVEPLTKRHRKKKATTTAEKRFPVTQLVGPLLLVVLSMLLLLLVLLLFACCWQTTLLFMTISLSCPLAALFISVFAFCLFTTTHTNAQSNSRAHQYTGSTHRRGKWVSGSQRERAGFCVAYFCARGVIKRFPRCYSRNRCIFLPFFFLVCQDIFLNSSIRVSCLVWLSVSVCGCYQWHRTEDSGLIGPLMERLSEFSPKLILSKREKQGLDQLNFCLHLEEHGKRSPANCCKPFVVVLRVKAC